MGITSSRNQHAVFTVVDTAATPIVPRKRDQKGVERCNNCGQLCRIKENPYCSNCQYDLWSAHMQQKLWIESSNVRQRDAKFKRESAARRRAAAKEAQGENHAGTDKEATTADTDR